MTVFLLKNCPSFARIFTKMSLSEELVTLHMQELRELPIGTADSPGHGKVEVQVWIPVISL